MFFIGEQVELVSLQEIEDATENIANITGMFEIPPMPDIEIGAKGRVIRFEKCADGNLYHVLFPGVGFILCDDNMIKSIELIN